MIQTFCWTFASSEAGTGIRMAKTRHACRRKDHSQRRHRVQTSSRPEANIAVDVEFQRTVKKLDGDCVTPRNRSMASARFDLAAARKPT